MTSIKKKIRAGVIAQRPKCLPGKHRGLRLIPNTKNKQKTSQFVTLDTALVSQLSVTVTNACGNWLLKRKGLLSRSSWSVGKAEQNPAWPRDRRGRKKRLGPLCPLQSEP